MLSGLSSLQVTTAQGKENSAFGILLVLAGKTKFEQAKNLNYCRYQKRFFQNKSKETLARLAGES